MTTNRLKAAAVPAPEQPLNPNRMVRKDLSFIRNNADDIHNGDDSYRAFD
jgi:hypothetical protein